MHTKWIGTMGFLVTMGLLLRKPKVISTFYVDPAAAAELKKVLMYAAPPTFLATVSYVEQQGSTLRWID